MTIPVATALYRAFKSPLVQVASLACCFSLNATTLMAGGEVYMLPSPAASNSSLSRIVSDEEGRVYLSWVAREGGLAKLAFARLSGDSWTDPQIVSEGSNWFINWADFPALSVNAGNLVAHWLAMSAEGTYDYDIHARFFDATASLWSDPIVLHKDGVSAEHGFVSMLPLPDGQTLISWLDGRNTVVPEGYGQMTLRAGVFGPDGQTLREWELDPRVCDCCQTSTASSSDGPVVVYRDRSDDEIRDIYITRFRDGSWSTPRVVYADNWRIAGCPVNGPAVAADGDRVAVSWFSAKDDTPKVQLALSNDGGESFNEPLLIASPDTIGRLGIAMLEGGETVVSWLDTSGEAAAITFSRFSEDGEFMDATVVAQTSASRRSGFPVIEALGNSVYVTWTDVSGIPQVKIARVDFNSEDISSAPADH